jgi:hypothetical protein
MGRASAPPYRLQASLLSAAYSLDFDAVPLAAEAVAPPQRLGSCSFVDVLLCVSTFYRLYMVFETVLIAMWICFSLEDFLHIGRGASFLSIPVPRDFSTLSGVLVPHILLAMSLAQ